ncbi:MAG: CDP-diacylglycerol--glycerol-3-phosphate 3-phosphatidyltransferase [Oscillospiraceae bacterium]|nr:CDP-diacylglycerol--glycerol-3-phosphate 3-phosphatidyltransferase [Oscillospiraceae bacterium]
MNLPNKLTAMRVVLVPVFMFFMLCDAIPLNILWGGLVFGVAAITDLIDGRLARKYNLITNFGKFLDPIADKILVMAAVLCFCAKGWIDVVAVFIILTREFVVSGLRLVVAGEGVVVPAGIWGKLKTASTMAAIGVIMAIEFFLVDIFAIDFNFFIINEIIIWICTVLTIISGVTYVYAYKDYINPEK